MPVSRDTVREMWRVELERGLVLLRRGAFERAADHFARAHRAAPAEPTVCYAYGRELLRAGDFDRGEDLLRRAWTADHNLVGAAATLARSLGIDGGRLEEAHELLDEAEATGGDPGAVLVVRAELFLEEERADDAREVAGRAIELDDSDYVLLSARAVIARADNLDGVALSESGELDAALFRFRRAAVADPDWVAPRLNAAVVFERLGRLQAALRNAGEALSVDPAHRGALIQRARLLSLLGREDEAICDLAEAIDEDPESGELICALAELHLGRGEAGEACDLLVDHLRDHLRQVGADARAWFVLARAQLAGGDLDMAEDCLRQVLQLDPDHAGARRLLADLLARQGRYMEAAAQAERAGGFDADASLDYFWGGAGRPAGPKRPR